MRTAIAILVSGPVGTKVMVPGSLAIMVSHDVSPRASARAGGWARAADAVQAAFAVNRRSHFLRTHDGTVASGVHGHVGGVRLFEHRAGVVRHLSRLWLPPTVVTPKSSISGLPSASRMATASSCPGSQSRMIFFVTIAPLKEGLLCMPSGKSIKKYSAKGITLKFSASEMNRMRKLKYVYDADMIRCCAEQKLLNATC